MKKYDVVIIGSGPAGMAAAINSSSEGLDTLIIEASSELGGQARKSIKIENYPGFPEGVSGADLTTYCVAQMKKSGRMCWLRFRLLELRQAAIRKLSRSEMTPKLRPRP